MTCFNFYKEKDVNANLVLRKGETKLGERLQYVRNDWSDLSSLKAQFVIIGIPEDIGVRANKGIGGTTTAWGAFLKSFLNIQETEALQGENFILLGSLNVQDDGENNDIVQLRQKTEAIDKEVFPIIKATVEAGKIPIIIGGGHNNAFPILKGSSLALKQEVNAVNLDAHSDFRALEGRHSGNGFRYAHAGGFLKKYALLGLHEAYNSQDIIKELKNNRDFLPIFWEDIFLREIISWKEAIQNCIQHVNDKPFGVELDMDSIENVLSSAQTPIGISGIQAMQYLYRCALEPRTVYLHLPEATEVRADGLKNPMTGKLLSYLVQAFCTGVVERK